MHACATTPLHCCAPVVDYHAVPCLVFAVLFAPKHHPPINVSPHPPLPQLLSLHPLLLVRTPASPYGGTSAYGLTSFMQPQAQAQAQQPMVAVDARENPFGLDRLKQQVDSAVKDESPYAKKGASSYPLPSSPLFSPSAPYPHRLNWVQMASWRWGAASPPPYVCL